MKREPSVLSGVEGRSAKQEEAVRRTIGDKRPEPLKMAFAPWTRGAVMQLIAQQCGVKLSMRAVGNELNRWGFMPSARSGSSVRTVRVGQG